MHYNTTNETGYLLKKFGLKAGSQEAIIAEFFQKRKDQTFGPSDVRRLLMSELGTAPITSVRRAITNLTNNSVLVNTGNKEDGLYGRPEYQWQFNGEA